MNGTAFPVSRTKNSNYIDLSDTRTRELLSSRIVRLHLRIVDETSWSNSPSRPTRNSTYSLVRSSSRMIDSNCCSITNGSSTSLCPKKLTANKFIKISPLEILHTGIANQNLILVIISLIKERIKRKFIFLLPTLPSNSYYND